MIYWSGGGGGSADPGGGYHYENIIYDDLVKPENAKKEGVDMFKLFNVYLVYAEKRNEPTIIVEKSVLAKDAEDAKIKSGLLAKVDKSLDSDYLTIYADEICDVKVKSKPTETKAV